MGATPSPELIRAEILRLVAARDVGKTICPSDVARSLVPANWRPLMQPVRDAAATLLARGEIAVTQRGAPVDPLTARGPIRLGHPPA